MNELVKLGPWFAAYGLDTPDKIADVLDEAWSLRDRQVKKITRLEAIVAKLPKCWQQVDGKPLWKLVQDCAIYLSMTVWWNGRDEICNGMVTSIGRNEDGDSVFTDTGAAVAVGDCADSPEAAEALAAKQRKEPGDGS